MLDPVRDRSPISNGSWPASVWHLQSVRFRVRCRLSTFARESRAVDAMNHRHRLLIVVLDVADFGRNFPSKVIPTESRSNPPRTNLEELFPRETNRLTFCFWISAPLFVSPFRSGAAWKLARTKRRTLAGASWRVCFEVQRLRVRCARGLPRSVAARDGDHHVLTPRNPTSFALVFRRARIASTFMPVTPRTPGVSSFHGGSLESEPSLECREDSTPPSSPTPIRDDPCSLHVNGRNSVRRYIVRFLRARSRCIDGPQPR